MEKFIKALNETINACSRLSEEWEKIEADYGDKLSEGYPFDKDFREVVFALMEWKEKIGS